MKELDTFAVEFYLIFFRFHLIFLKLKNCISFFMKNHLILALVLLVSPSLFSQLDSLAAEVHLVQNTDSLNSRSPLLSLEVYLNDISDFGALTVRVFEGNSQNPRAVFYGAKSDIESQNLINGNNILIQFPNLDDNKSYNLFIEVQNTAMIYLKSLSLNYQPN
ncbi:hypothetical protein [Fluviicola sp.]|uniref:hypothetical protein n=1 Tax=Fluviicola sp. TaxID=1917219 RepID=UPI0026201C64|nr:hypothetical protein [Fluviicola sp.]